MTERPSCLAWVYYKDEVMVIEDLDHDSNPEYWKKHGATHWRHPTQEELDHYYNMSQQ